MVTIKDGKVYYDGDVVGSEEELNNMPRRYVLK